MHTNIYLSPTGLTSAYFMRNLKDLLTRTWIWLPC